MAERKISIIVAHGGLDQIYPGLIMASGARQAGIQCSLFFTFFGLFAVTESKIDHLHVNLTGNPNSPLPTLLSALPGMDTIAAKAMGWKMESLDIPGPREMMKELDEAGVEMYGCHLAMEMFGLKKKDLIPQVRDVITVADFYSLAEGGQILFT
ncbi:MAG: DsrE/DsrF/DrsH-like family protein [Vulcanimicrobiota bacterium]